MHERGTRFRIKDAFNLLVVSCFILIVMHLVGLSPVWSVAALAAFGLGMMAVVSLVACDWDLAQCLGVWRFVLFECPSDWILEKLSRPLTSDPESQAKRLSDVLQIPLVDAELKLELSGAFFCPTDNPELNGEALDLFLAPAPHNESWRTRAGECCQKLRALEQERPARVRPTPQRA